MDVLGRAPTLEFRLKMVKFRPISEQIGKFRLNQTTFWANSDFARRIVPISDFSLFLGLLPCPEPLKC